MKRRGCGLGGVVLGAALLSGCTVGTVEMAAYDWHMPLRKSAMEKYHQVRVNVSAGEGVQLPPSTRERLAVRISECFSSASGGKLMPVALDRTGEGTLDAQVSITRYDDGVLFARSSFREPESMNIDGEVILSDGLSKERLAVFGVSQTYDRSRTFAGLTTIDELEPLFAQGVVDGITQQPR